MDQAVPTKWRLMPMPKAMGTSSGSVWKAGMVMAQHSAMLAKA